MRINLNVVIIAIVVIANIIAFTGSYYDWKQRRETPVAIDKQAPEFEWTDYEGKSHAFSELKGKPVIMHFWATWCAPCIQEFPELMRSAVNNPGIIYLTVSNDRDVKLAEGFVEKMRLKIGGVSPSNMLYAIDPRRTVTTDIFQTAVFPETVLIDKAHLMRGKYRGVVDWESANVQRYLDALSMPHD